MPKYKIIYNLIEGDYHQDKGKSPAKSFQLKPLEFPNTFSKGETIRLGEGISGEVTSICHFLNNNYSEVDVDEYYEQIKNVPMPTFEQNAKSLEELLREKDWLEK